MHRLIWLRILLTIILAAVLVGGGFILFNSGFSAGYHAGLLGANSGVTSGITPQIPYYGFGPFGLGGSGLFLWPIFPLFGIGIFFLFMFLVGGVFRLWGWSRWGGRHGMHDWGYGPHPFQPSGTEDQPKKANPEEQAGSH